MTDWFSNHQQNVSKRTQLMREKGLFCDIDVHVDGAVYRCHRLVLAASSDLFLAKFTESSPTSANKIIVGQRPPGLVTVPLSDTENLTDSVREACQLADLKNFPKENEKISTILLRSAEVTSFHDSPKSSESCVLRDCSVATLYIDRVSKGAFSAILDALYTGKDPVTAGNAIELFKAAEVLQIADIIQLCEVKIVDLVRERKIDPICLIFDRDVTSSVILAAAMENLLCTFRPESSKSEWFLNLPLEKLLYLLDDDRLNIADEDEAYQALMNWYQHDSLLREQFLEEALCKLRLANLSARTLVEKVLTNPLCWDTGSHGVGDVLSRNSTCSLKQLVQRALAYHLLPDTRHSERLRIMDFRASQAQERVLLVMGDQADKLYAFSFRYQIWYKLAGPPQPFSLGMAACVHADDLYVSGGEKTLTSFWRYRARTGKWKRLADLKVGRRSHSCVAIGDTLYVVGGKDDRLHATKDTLDSLEKYTVSESDQGWTLLGGVRLTVPVRSMATAAINKKIYLIGGRTNGFTETVSIVQCFDTTTNQCSIVSHLSAPSCLARTFTFQKVIYILETNGDVLRFQPRGETNLRLDFTAVRMSSIVSRDPQREHTIPSGQLNGDDLKRHNEVEVNSRADGYVNDVVSKVGHIQNMNWKWYDVALDYDGTLYVVAGELPSNGQVPTIIAGSEGSVFRRACFIRPEQMSLCYTAVHMCVPKTRFIERIS